MRQADAADQRTGTRHCGCFLERGVGTDAFEHGVRSAIAQLEEPRHAFVAAFGHVVRGAELLRERKAVGVPACGDDVLGTHHLRGDDAALPHRAVTEHDHRVSRLHACRARRMVAGCHHVGKREQALEHAFAVVPGLARDLHKRPLRVLEADVPALRTHREVVRMRHARPVVARAACAALAAAVRERRDHKIAGLDRGDGPAHFLHDADGLVARVRGMVVACVDAAERPQVRTAHTGAHHAHNRIVGLFDDRLRHVLHGHVARRFKHGAFHRLRHICSHLSAHMHRAYACLSTVGSCGRMRAEPSKSISRQRGRISGSRGCLGPARCRCPRPDAPLCAV